MDYLYFPGCTLYTKAKNFDQTARNCSRLLGFELKELKNWTCCGATFPLATDNIMALLAPSRILATAKEEGNTLTTLCAICFNVIKRTNRLIKEDGEKRDKINNFIEKNYQGDLQILHYLEILKQNVGFSQLKEKTRKPLAGLKEGAYKILRSALKNGAEAMVSTCPMCTFNIDHKQSDIKQKYSDFKPIPVFYFTQLLGMAMGLDYQTLGFEQNAVDPLPLLREKGLL